MGSFSKSSWRVSLRFVRVNGKCGIDANRQDLILEGVVEDFRGVRYRPILENNETSPDQYHVKNHA